MTRRPITRIRRSAAARAAGMTTLVAIALAAVAGVPSTTAAYTDTAAAETSPTDTPLLTQAARMIPTNTYLANTATALQDDGTLWVWGFRGNGLAGNGTLTVPSTASPSPVVLPNDGYTGANHRYIVKVAGTSLDDFYPTDINYTGLAALSDDGQVYTWGGSNTNNVMGRPSTPIPYTQPGPVAIPGTVVDLRSSSGVFMALTSTGDLYTWGNAQGRGITGQGSATASSPTPSLIMSGVHSIGAGMWNGWAVRGNFDPNDPTTGVFWWGWANAGSSYASDPSGDNLGTNQYTPTRSTGLSPFAQSGCDTVGVVMGSPADQCSIESLTGHYFGNQLVAVGGHLVTWGDASNFGTGRAYVSGPISATPIALTLPNDDLVKQIAPSQDYVEVLGMSGQVYIYGRYSFARGPDPVSGTASTTNIVTPTPLLPLGDTVSAVGAFGYSGTALNADGSFVNWGGSTAGGNNNTYSSIINSWAANTTPTNAVQGLTTMITPGS
ncbi:hypothetical protein [Leifsonia shinshuensis]|uniref:Chromosome condensation regulator RCC1 n=1 Tax=Leifsonia shinshuensis TaxID=150026 RepID=A0A7G6Y7A2_9MICO|nr:hypothetical protein [Leifsonia shinshuensis]QNE34367.1 hypothetical protein F1C12_03930 [Leifsonia shinshuensis]